jgi:hypothetical protein
MGVDMERRSAATREQSGVLNTSSKDHKVNHVQLPEQNVHEIRREPRLPSLGQNNRWDDDNYCTPPEMYDAPSLSDVDEYNSLQYGPETCSEYGRLMLQVEAQNAAVEEGMEWHEHVLKGARLQEMIEMEEQLDESDILKAM